MILSAATAESSPLLPCLPPLLSCDCSILLSVNTQKITGVLYKIFRSLIPVETALHMKSK